GPDVLAIVPTLFEAVGWVGVVPESMLDVVTAVSGSGPAYIYMLAEALVDSGEQAGLPRDLARALVAQTILGAGKMLIETGEAPDLLREQVTPPGGRPWAGLRPLGQEGRLARVPGAGPGAPRRARRLRSARAAPPRYPAAR